MIASRWLGALLLVGIGEDADPVVLGTEAIRFEWDSDWPTLPEGTEMGSTHGQVAVDSQGLIYVTTDTDRAMRVFDAEGRLVREFGAELKGGLHGLAFTHGKEHGEILLVAHTGLHQVLMMTLEGEVLKRLGPPRSADPGAPAAEGPLYAEERLYKPTGVAVAPDGGFYVGDGYGASFVHRYDRDGNHVRSFGGLGTEPGRMRVPHDLWIDTRNVPAVLVVADRENHRLQTFDLKENRLLKVIDGLLQPTALGQWGDYLVVPELQGRVTLLDREYAVVARLGENPDSSLRGAFKVPRERWRDGEFTAPHGAAFDAEGNLYVSDWNHLGRVSRLRRIDSSPR